MKYLILILISLGIYANSLNGDYIIDDIPLVQTEIIQQAEWYHATSYLSKFIINNFGTEKLPLHFPSLILHAINVLLVFLILKGFFKETPAFLGALIFAVHPIHCEAICWVSGRGYLFMSFAWLSTFYLYSKGKLWRYLLALVIFTYFSIVHYPWMASLVIVMVLIPIMFKDNHKSYKWGWLPFAIILTMIVFKNQTVIGERIIASDSGMLDWKRQFLVVCYSIGYNFYYCFAPIKLMIYHQFKFEIMYRLWQGFAWLITYIFFLLVYLTNYWKEGGKTLLFWVLVFIVMLFPTYSPVAICWIVAERYLYLPSILFSVIVACAYYASAKKYPKTFWITFSIIFILFCGKTLHRNYEWGDRLRFWKVEVRSEERSAIARNNLATSYLQRGDYKKARKHFEISVMLEPNKARAWYNLGVIAHVEVLDAVKETKLIDKAILKKIEEAMYYYRVALSREPMHEKALNNMEMLFRNIGLDKEAEKVSKEPRKQNRSIWLEIRDDIKRGELK